MAKRKLDLATLIPEGREPSGSIHFRANETDWQRITEIKRGWEEETGLMYSVTDIIRACVSLGHATLREDEPPAIKASKATPAPSGPPAGKKTKRSPRPRKDSVVHVPAAGEVASHVD